MNDDLDLCLFPKWNSLPLSLDQHLVMVIITTFSPLFSNLPAMPPVPTSLRPSLPLLFFL